MYTSKNVKMCILFRKSSPAVYKASPFQPFSFPCVDNNSKITIEVFIRIIIYNIYHNLFNGLSHNKHTHIHLSGILDLSKLYHHNSMLLYRSKNGVLLLQ